MFAVTPSWLEFFTSHEVSRTLLPLFGSSTSLQPNSVFFSYRSSTSLPPPTNSDFLSHYSSTSTSSSPRNRVVRSPPRISHPRPGKQCTTLLRCSRTGRAGERRPDPHAASPTRVARATPPPRPQAHGRGRGGPRLRLPRWTKTHARARPSALHSAHTAGATALASKAQTRGAPTRTPPTTGERAGGASSLIPTRAGR